MIQSELIDHSHYSLGERERLQQAATTLIAPSRPHILLATCNRTELYYGNGEIPAALARHLFRVAAGLESALLGERAIMGQLKEAYLQASTRYKLPGELNRLFQAAIHVGHRVRTETGISRGAISHSQVTADLIRDLCPGLNRSVISIIGINELTESLLNFLTARGATKLILSNRHPDKAEALATRYGALALPLSDKARLIQISDIIISATSAPHTILHRTDFERYPELHRPQFLFDLAFPRDIDPEISQLPGKRIYNLEQIEAHAQANRAIRHSEIPRCEAIIEEEIEELMRWQRFRSRITTCKTSTL